MYIYTYIKQNRRRGMFSLGVCRAFFVYCFGTSKFCTNNSPKAWPRESENHGKPISRCFFPCVTPLEEQVRKKRLRREPPRTSIYAVLSGQNVTFRFLAWLQKHWKRCLLSCPLAPQTHSFSMKVEKKGVWEKDEKTLKMASAIKRKSNQTNDQNGGSNPGQIQGWKPSCPRVAPDPEKTPKHIPKSL